MLIWVAYFVSEGRRVKNRHGKSVANLISFSKCKKHINIKEKQYRIFSILLSWDVHVYLCCCMY